MTAIPLDVERYHARLEALTAYVEARGADTAAPTVETQADAAARDAAYERYAAIRDQDGPAPEPNSELEAGS